jgi:DNA-binding XRE family transcriptional regulator
MNIRGYRASLNLTQSKIAEKIGTSRNSYALKENKKRLFTLEEAVSLSNLFGITLEEFYRASKE